MVDPFMGKIVCYENGDSGLTQIAGKIEGYYLNSNYLRNGMNAWSEDYYGKDILEVCQALSDSELCDEAINSEVRDLSGCDLKNPDVFVILDIYLKPEFRHKRLGCKVIKATIDHLAKSAGAVAIRISPTQIGMDWDYQTAKETFRADPDLVDTPGLSQLFPIPLFDEDVQEFEALTDKDAHRKLVSHFDNMGFRQLSYSDNLMVINPLEILCA